MKKIDGGATAPRVEAMCAASQLPEGNPPVWKMQPHVNPKHDDDSLYV